MSEKTDDTGKRSLRHIPLFATSSPKHTGAWDTRAYSIAAFAAPFAGGAMAVAICLVIAIFTRSAWTFAVFALFGVLFGLPAYVALGLPAFRFAIRRSTREGSAVILNIICAGQLANLVGYPLYFLIAFFLGPNAEKASEVALGYLVGGATLGLMNCIAFGWIYQASRPSPKPNDGDKK
ncbi:MAG: hypothetical protein AAGC81_08630 [Pseudomonadota bacterium]